MNPIGIMQGRLSLAPAGRPQAFPWLTWQAEFAQAAACGFDLIEWLVTADGFDHNPLGTDTGVADIQSRIAATGVAVSSVCADFCITHPLVRVTDRERQATIERLERIVECSARIGANLLLIPILEGGAIRNADEAAVAVAALDRVAKVAAARGIRLGLETDLPAAAMCEWLDHLPGVVGAYYDVGNAAAAGFDPAAETRALGPALFGVHIKDRKRGGGSVPLGQGDVDFPGLFAALADTGYAGPLILETPVGVDPQVMAERHLAFVQHPRR